MASAKALRQQGVGISESGRDQCGLSSGKPWVPGWGNKWENCHLQHRVWFDSGEVGKMMVLFKQVSAKRIPVS